jgi:hypothetical protein
MRNIQGVIFGGVFLVAICFTVDAKACSTASWDGGSSGAVSVGSPSSTPRYSQLCGLSVNGTGHVQDNSASDSRIIVRFYVQVSLGDTGAVDLFEAYGDEAGVSPIFKVTYDADADNFIFDATDAPGGSSFTIAAKSGWNLVELDWDSGGDFVAWVNEDTTTEPQPTPAGPVDAGTGTVESVRLGAPNGFGNFSGSNLYYDAYESHRTAPVGALLIGDADDSQIVDIFDVVEQLDEIHSIDLGVGQPDCDESGGAVDIFDVVCVLDIIHSN